MSEDWSPIASPTREDVAALLADGLVGGNSCMRAVNGQWKRVDPEEFFRPSIGLALRRDPPRETCASPTLLAVAEDAPHPWLHAFNTHAKPVHKQSRASFPAFVNHAAWKADDAYPWAAEAARIACQRMIAELGDWRDGPPEAVREYGRNRARMRFAYGHAMMTEDP